MKKLILLAMILLSIPVNACGKHDGMTELFPSAARGIIFQEERFYKILTYFQ